MSELVKIGRRLDNIKDEINSNFPKDKWVMDKLHSLFVRSIQSNVSIEKEKIEVEKLNKLLDTYEFRFGKTFENLNERHLTKQELAVREKILQDLKANKKGLVKRYGADAEKVMYGISTKRAKAEVEKQGKQRIKEIIRSILKPESKGNE